MEHFRGSKAPARAAALVRTLEIQGALDWIVTTGKGWQVLTANGFSRMSPADVAELLGAGYLEPFYAMDSADSDS